MAFPPCRWRPLGLVHVPDGTQAWARSHASLPVTQALGGGRHAVFFATRDDQQRSHVSRLTMRVDGDVWAVESVDPSPVLAPGPLGCFDDHGVYPSSIVTLEDGTIRLYYIGWNPGARGPLFYATIGLAVSRDGGATFQRHSAVPLMGRGEHDPCLVTSPLVIRRAEAWRMYYVSGFKWVEDATGMHSHYDIKIAHSQDGLAWERRGECAIALRPGESNVARAAWWADAHGERMLYSYVQDGKGYRLGYAESLDGIQWERRDANMNLDVVPGTWESDMQAYPHVFESGGSHYLLYNGNGFGRTGFGMAKLEEVH